MPEVYIHEHESNIDEDFIKSKRQAFESDAKFLLDLLYRGWRLNGRQVEMWGINSRRLRELAVSHKEVHREWKLNKDNKREVMEYFLSVPQQPTKTELNQWFAEFQNGNHDTPIIDISINRNYSQQSLFNE